MFADQDGSMPSPPPLTPPTSLDQAAAPLGPLSKPMRLVVLGWFAGGFTFALGVFFPDLDVNPATAQVPITELVLGIMAMLGSLFVSFGQLPWRNVATRWQMEMMGWPILASAWILYIILVVLSGPAALFPMMIGLSSLAACVQRFVEVILKSQHTRSNVSAWEKIRDALEGEPDDA